ncbi:MAG: divalent-cation tolerance protein CutA [Candidatus Nanohaloarchaea archaeon]|nr:divalent-cation tolerance protein CutA [Candidatus Nanohaloarchaea archaeon]
MLLLYTTFEEEDLARSTARTLLKEGLIASANITEIESLYRWQGDIMEEKEYLMLCKTTDEEKEQLQERLDELHPYDTPAIVFYEASDTSGPYEDWVQEVTG